MRINLPNQITLLRFVLAIIFCVLMARFDDRQRERTAWMIDWGLTLFIIAALTDIVDGYLARRWNQVTSFGRLIDPFVDKVLVCGAFVLMLGRNFVDERGANATGMEAWMVVIILGRELLVTGLRGFSEARGQGYGAHLFGKIKMVVQSITVAVILFCLTHARHLPAWLLCRDALIWITVGITTASLVVYLMRSRDILLEQAR